VLGSFQVTVVSFVAKCFFMMQASFDTCG